MAAKTVKTRLVVEKKCKNSVRYSTKDKAKEETLLTIYMMNPAVKKLGSPDEIEVSICSVPSEKQS
ncbi:hypothetical protein LCGC14_1881000 [marine sediment metagenome]|uniref:Uncharacterized protein n=1 Tax=marine sediment metagenome TaxID=412755 RepID=A0A0F9IGB3_9ZZZZ